jgi:hypothetical protein
MQRAALAIVLCLSPLTCAEPAPPPSQSAPGGQSYKDAIHMICNVDHAVALDADASILDVAERRHDYLQERVKNPDGIYYYTIFRTQDPLQQAASLRHEAREIRLQSCALADSLEREGG